ncbi:TOBE domain-containing protein, partial [Curtobacterium poinsettiae]|uniref:TOBE domain-containing protein n=1 Tax=Curtobacterium poinsettiae TaxID=159612 RepID=UPI0021C7CD35
GSPAMTLLPADVSLEGGIKFGTLNHAIDRDTLSNARAAQITVGIRPEDVVVSQSGEGLPVTVDVVEELGADGYLYGHADVNGQRADIVARVDGRAHPSIGDTIVITPKQGHVHAFDTESGDRLDDKAVVSA